MFCSKLSKQVTMYVSTNNDLERLVLTIAVHAYRSCKQLLLRMFYHKHDASQCCSSMKVIRYIKSEDGVGIIVQGKYFINANVQANKDRFQILIDIRQNTKFGWCRHASCFCFQFQFLRFKLPILSCYPRAQASRVM